MTPTVTTSVREDDASIYYSHRRGHHAVTLTVLKVSDEFIGCDVTTHSADPGGDLCAAIDLPGTCMGHSLAFARAFYAALQAEGKAERVDDERVIGALMSHLREEFGT